MTSLTAAWSRLYAVLGRVSMYRLGIFVLGALAVIAFGLSFFGVLTPGPGELLATWAVLAVVSAACDLAAHAILGRAWRWESTLITVLVLLFVLRPTTDALGLVGVGIAAAAASASKYVLAWQGRHVFNPAAVGATVLTILSIWWPALGASSWWVGSPYLAGPVIALGLIVLVRTEKVRVIGLFLVVAVAIAFARTAFQYQSAALPFDAGSVFWQILWSSPFLFLGAFMLSEPLTLPPRRWQQYVVAAVVGALAGWPIDLGGVMSLGQERALLVGNAVAFVFAARTAVRLTLTDRVWITPSVRELTFRAEHRFRFVAGQYLELEVPHEHPDARGTRREFSIVSAPDELPSVKIAYREGSQSSYKKALAEVERGGVLSVTGVWGDFVLPSSPARPVLMVAAGIGVTPFVSQLRHAGVGVERRDIVLIYVASGADELAFREDVIASGVPVIVFTKDDPGTLPAHWRWAQGVRLTAASLIDVVPDLATRHAYISGPPTLIADLAPALEKAHSVTTDAFSGY